MYVKYDITPKDMAELLDISVRTLERWRKDKCGPPYLRMGGRIFYNMLDLKIWRQENMIYPERGRK